MRVDGVAMRTIWRAGDAVRIIDQTRLPHRFEVLRLDTLYDAVRAIADMHVRGAPLIGVTAAYGLALAMAANASDAGLTQARAELLRTRPTAVNLRWALDEAYAYLVAQPQDARRDAAFAFAGALAQQDVECNESIGEHGLGLIREAARQTGRARIMTHCNAGWLATVDWGTATAPIYKAFAEGIDVEVIVSETRPRNQGAALTAWELAQEGVPHVLIVDNAAGHLMRQGGVDLVIVGTDRTTRAGDVCNKIGTYLKALAAHDNGVPFYVAAPSASIDFDLETGAGIEIESRSQREVTHVWGLDESGQGRTVRVSPEPTCALNPGFDVTPARLVSGLITERGLCASGSSGIAALFPDRLTDG